MVVVEAGQVTDPHWLTGEHAPERLATQRRKRDLPVGQVQDQPITGGVIAEPVG